MSSSRRGLLAPPTKEEMIFYRKMFNILHSFKYVYDGNTNEMKDELYTHDDLLKFVSKKDVEQIPTLSTIYNMRELIFLAFIDCDKGIAMANVLLEKMYYEDAYLVFSHHGAKEKANLCISKMI